MSFLELICFAAASVALYFLAYAVSQYTLFGWLIVLPVLFFWLKLISSTVGSLLFAHKKGKSLPRPVCANGKCQSKDYTFVDSGPAGITLQCKCGDRYVSQGTYFSRIMPNGTMQPYMTLQRNGEWTRDAVAPYPSRN